jgi:mannose-6-phosphate isomerase-like protein (cupin superfamily)
MSVQINDLELLDAVSQFALAHPHPDVERFKKSMRDWGENWLAVDESYLSAADLLGASIATSNPQTHGLLERFEQHKHRLHWEQSYKKEDGVVSAAMLAAYGFAEIIGKKGPFVSDRIRAGIGIYGPNIVYPRHQHQAEEVYIVLAGSAEFKVGDRAAATRQVGDVIFVASNTPHGFCTSDQSLVIYYLWQAGDLRQISDFG